MFAGRLSDKMSGEPGRMFLHRRVLFIRQTGGNMSKTRVALVPLKEEDREQFIKDNQKAFKYGATEEFGVRDEHFE